MTKHNVALLVASTRKGSLNQRLAKAIIRLSPPALTYTSVAMDDLPFYSEDLEPSRPLSVQTFVRGIQQADAVCIVTPEYNRSIPAVLKNAIDWGSKPASENVWRDKVIAITGTSPGAIGTALGQQHLRQILAVQGAHVMPGEVYISFSRPDLIDDAGEVIIDGTKDFIAAFADKFASLIGRFAP